MTELNSFKITAAFVVDAGLTGRTRRITSASDDADAVVTDVASVAGSVAVTHRATHSVDAAIVGQTALVTVSTNFQIIQMRSNQN